MAYVYLAPDMHDDPRIRKAAHMSHEAVWLWFECLCWRSQQRGAMGDPHEFLPAVVAKHFLGRKKKPLKALLDSGLWEKAPKRRGRSGYRMAGQGKLWRLSAPTQRRPAIPDAIRLRVYERDGHQCVTCGTGENLTLDHIYPWSLGGPDTYENLQAMCRSCNSRKGARV